MRTALVSMGMLFLRQRVLGDSADAFVILLVCLMCLGLLAAIIQDWNELRKS